MLVKVCSRPQISLKYICLPSERPRTTASSGLKYGLIRQVVASTPHSCNQPRVGLFRSVSRFGRARLPPSPPPPVDIVCAMRTLVACGDPHCATLWRGALGQRTASADAVADGAALASLTLEWGSRPPADAGFRLRRGSEPTARVKGGEGRAVELEVR